MVQMVDTVEALNEKLAELKAAQAKYATYSQEQVDKIFLAAATAANKMRIPLASSTTSGSSTMCFLKFPSITGTNFLSAMIMPSFILK